MYGLIAIAAIQTALGIYQIVKSQQAQKELDKQKMPAFAVSPELQASKTRAEQLAKQGFTTEETAAFEQSLAKAGEQEYRRATDIAGGNLAPAISAGIQSQNIGAIGEFAAQGAGLRRKNIAYADAITSEIQRQKNMETDAELQYRLMKEQALGAAGKAGYENISEGASIGATAYNP